MSQAGRRGDVLIEPYKQLKFGFIFLLTNLVFSIAILGVFGFYMWDMYEALVHYLQLTTPESLESLKKFAIPATIGFVLILIFIAITLLFSVRYTHQIYGPLVSIRRFLDQLVEGQKPERIRLRSTDQLQDLVERLNKISDRLGEQNISPSALEQIMEFTEALAHNKPSSYLKISAEDKLFALAENLNTLKKHIEKG